jgi:hypothetical protein
VARQEDGSRGMKAFAEGGMMKVDERERIGRWRRVGEAKPGQNQQGPSQDRAKINVKGGKICVYRVDKGSFD